jgi:hypothetical protein
MIQLKVLKISQKQTNLQVTNYNIVLYRNKNNKGSKASM